MLVLNLAVLAPLLHAAWKATVAASATAEESLASALSQACENTSAAPDEPSVVDAYGFHIPPEHHTLFRTPSHTRGPEGAAAVWALFAAGDTAGGLRGLVASQQLWHDGIPRGQRATVWAAIVALFRAHPDNMGHTYCEYMAQEATHVSDEVA